MSNDDRGTVKGTKNNLKNYAYNYKEKNDISQKHLRERKTIKFNSHRTYSKKCSVRQLLTYLTSLWKWMAEQVQREMVTAERFSRQKTGRYGNL